MRQPRFMNLARCTLTGVDERTDLRQVVQLSAEFPFVEWGFLYSPKRQGQPGRYPPVEMMARCFQSLPSSVDVAMHVCGDGVHRLLEGGSIERDLLAMIESRGGRIQLNFNQLRSPADLNKLAALMLDQAGTTFITQHNSANADVWTYLADRGANNHAVLFDASGGQGIPCLNWPAPLPVACGYAGGLGPDNIQAEILRIAAVADGRKIWIDMENKLRSTRDGCDWFDLAACRRCLETAGEALSNRMSAHGIG
ncbi:MAG: hypothetical protein K2W33_07545 [Burkholderiales bacterium]|nr:hypothetical protein [Burkholderiales bacterium]